MTREKKLQKLITAMGKIYYAQPKDERNGKAAIEQALNEGGVTNIPDREWYSSRMCSELGTNGGKTAAARRKQLAFDF